MVTKICNCGTCEKGYEVDRGIFRCKHPAQRFRVDPSRENIALHCFSKYGHTMKISVYQDVFREFDWPARIDPCVIVECTGYSEKANGNTRALAENKVNR